MEKNIIKKVFAENFELPKDVVYDIPQIRVIGDGEAYVENHKGIIEYSSDLLRLNSKIGIIKITGNNLYIKKVSGEDICVVGEIKSIEVIKWGD